MALRAQDSCKLGKPQTLLRAKTGSIVSLASLILKTAWHTKTLLSGSIKLACLKQKLESQAPDDETYHVQILLLLLADGPSMCTVGIPELMPSLCWFSHATTFSTPMALCCSVKTEGPIDFRIMFPTTIFSWITSQHPNILSCNVWLHISKFR